MPEVLVHVVLQRAVGANQAERRQVYERITSIAGLRDVNLLRFERYGILTGWADERDLARIQQVPGVESVEPDRQRAAIV